MLRYLVFWRQPLSVAGTCGPDTALGRIRALIAREGRGIGMAERLLGRIDGHRLEVWRAAPLAQLGDTVEFVGELRASGEGSVVEGELRYRLRTRVQFVGCLLLAAAIAAVGVLRLLADRDGGDLIGIGAVIGVATLFWMYSSRQMVGHQARFIRERLAQAIEGDEDQA